LGISDREADTLHIYNFNFILHLTVDHQHDT